MIFLETPFTGAFVLDLEPHTDERGFFARVSCQQEFEAHGLEHRIVQSSISFNQRSGTLRGLHYQSEPFGEIKIVRCTSGAIFDVIVDLRTGSSTIGHHFSVVLSAANRRSLYVPRGFAHGFQTLSDNTEVSYQISEVFRPEASRGVRWNDPAFGIEWPPTPARTMNDRDRNYPDFSYSQFTKDQQSSS
jgi:dTDP-4-dehydrorhamnose 3,5-epimerase